MDRSAYAEVNIKLKPIRQTTIFDLAFIVRYACNVHDKCVRCVVRASERVCKGTINFAYMQIFTVFFLIFSHFANCV